MGDTVWILTHSGGQWVLPGGRHRGALRGGPQVRPAVVPHTQRNHSRSRDGWVWPRNLRSQLYAVWNHQSPQSRSWFWVQRRKVNINLSFQYCKKASEMIVCSGILNRSQFWTTFPSGTSFRQAFMLWCLWLESLVCQTHLLKTLLWVKLNFIGDLLTWVPSGFQSERSDERLSETLPFSLSYEASKETESLLPVRALKPAQGHSRHTKDSGKGTMHALQNKNYWVLLLVFCFQEYIRIFMLCYFKVTSKFTLFKSL